MWLQRSLRSLRHNRLSTSLRSGRTNPPRSPGTKAQRAAELVFASGGEAERLAERDAALRFAGPPRRDASGTRRRVRRRSHAQRIARRTAGAATRRTGPDARTRRNRRELIRVTHADSFAPASGAEPGGLRRFAQDFAPKPYLCTASGRKDAETGQAAGRAPLARKKPHVDKSRQADGIAIPPPETRLTPAFQGRNTVQA